MAFLRVGENWHVIVKLGKTGGFQLNEMDLRLLHGKSRFALRLEKLILFFLSFVFLLPVLKKKKIAELGKVFVYHLDLELVEMLNQL